jgi:hypothetical protein
MSVIDEYVKQVSKKYPDTREIREQLEEIRDTLHIKTEENQASGMGYREAAQSAIRSMGDLAGLMSIVAGESRVVYINRLMRANAFFATIIITVEILIGWGIVFLLPLLGAPDIFHGSVSAFWTSFTPVMVAVWIWPVISAVICSREPDKKEAVQMKTRELVKTGLIGWAALSVLLFFVNLLGGFEIVWFIWPVIGISNWPVNVWNYGRQLKSGKYDA